MSQAEPPNDRHALWINCRQASVLLSRRQDAPPRRAERIKIGLHLMACAMCRNAARQFDAIRLAMQRLRDGEP